MSRILIVGGIYAERAIWPDWDQVYGSAGRAGAALVGHVDEIEVHGYATSEARARFADVVQAYGVAFRPHATEQMVRFSYTHGLAQPQISPARSAIRRNPSISVGDEVVLRFGMLEGDAKVAAKVCVYDPQDQIAPEPFAANGSRAERLAIVANEAEVLAMSGASNLTSAVEALLADAEVVVVKSGPKGAFVHTRERQDSVPAYQSDQVWPVGSGDVFAALFAARWGVHGDDPLTAADLASRAVAAYVETMALPVPAPAELQSKNRPPVVTVPGLVYLASPFFSMGERWLVEEARRSLLAFGLHVFSPLHDVGPGDAQKVAPLDLKALDECDVVLALLDGLDSGTLFEVGYARRAGKPVYALAQTVSEEDLKMVEGSGCKVYADFVTLLHHVSWRA
jgi:hypothetical protein